MSTNDFRVSINVVVKKTRHNIDVRSVSCLTVLTWTDLGRWCDAPLNHATPGRDSR